MRRLKREATIDRLKRLMVRSLEDGEAVPSDELKRLHPADIADVLEELDEDERKEVFSLLDDATLAETVSEVVPEKKEEILRLLPRVRIREILSLLPPDDAVDTLTLLPEEEVRRMLDELKSSKAEQLRRLSLYRADTAGGVMTTEVVSVPEETTVKETTERLKKMPQTKNIEGVFVTDGEGRFKGFVSAYDLLVSPPEKRVSDLLKKRGVVVSADTDREEVARLFDKYDITVLPVVDESGKLLGAVTFDDAMDVMQSEASEDMYRIAGTMAVNPMKEKTLKRAVYRLPFLTITLVAGLALTLIAKYFKLTLESAVTLAFFIPVLNGMGGNVGLQAAMVVVRGIAVGEIQIQRLLKVLLRELSVGAIIGTICAVTAFFIALIIGTDPIVPYAVGIAMFAGMTVSAVMGILVPLMFWRVGIDPAVSAGPLVTTINDILMLSLYLSTATVLLKLGG